MPAPAHSNLLRHQEHCARAAIPSHRRCRPPLYLGVLEDRCLPATITVTSLADNLTVDGRVTLREAIQAANNNISVDSSTAGSSGADTIVFQPGLTGTIVINNALGQMTVSQSLTIRGQGASGTIIDATERSRIFDITDTAGNVTLEGLTLTKGKTLGDDGPAPDVTNKGGAIRFLSAGTLTIRNSVLSQNRTVGVNASGGAIFVRDGALTLENCTLSGNDTLQLQARGGAIYVIGTPSGPVTLTSCILTGNFALGGNASGGAIHSRNAPVSLTNTTLEANYTVGPNSRGGAVFTRFASATLTVTSSTLSGNLTAGSDNAPGGAIYAAEGAVTLTNSTLSGNFTRGGDSPGGAISTNTAAVTLNNSTVTLNRTQSASRAGAIHSTSGPVTLRSSIVAGNFEADTSPDDLFTTGTIIMTNSLLGIWNVGGVLTPTGLTPDASGNLIGGLVPGSGVSRAIDPRLYPLRNNGGPTKTHSLHPLSPAIDRGSNPLNLSRDQRGSGFPRVRGARADMGAFEAVPLFSTISVRKEPLKLTRFARKLVIGVWVRFESGERIYFLSPFQRRRFFDIRAETIDTDGDGVPNGLRFAAKERGRPRRFFSWTSPTQGIHFVARAPGPYREVSRIVLFDESLFG